MSSKLDTKMAGESTMSDVKEEHAMADSQAEPSIHEERNDVFETSNKALPKPLQKLQSAELWFNRKMGVEQLGIELLREEDKVPPSLWNAFLLWGSLNVHLGQVPIGLLGAELGLSLGMNLGAIIGGIALGTIGPAWCATLGPKVSCIAIRSYVSC